MRPFTTVATIGLLGTVVHAESHNAARTKQIAPFLDRDFLHITPSKELTWVPCSTDSKLSCAILTVPLDYDNLSAGTTNIKWIKYVSSKDSAEDIIFNPGGPGESGVEVVKNRDKRLFAQLRTQYNVISFAPRGVGGSGPELSCLPGVTKYPRLRGYEKECDQSTPASFRFNRALGEYCARKNANSSAKYAGTVAVVQDILHFINLRAAEKDSNRNLTANPPQLWYYGVSYGTVIGHTFANLFPDRIGRMILEGNVDSVEYYTGITPSSLEDTDAAYEDFFKSCFRAGPLKCEFHGNSTSPEELENRYTILLQKLREYPLTYVINDTFGLITAAEVNRFVFLKLYQLAWNAEDIAALLSLVEQRRAKDAYRNFLRAYDGDSPYHYDIYPGYLIHCVDATQNWPIRRSAEYLAMSELFKKKSYFQGSDFAMWGVRKCVGMYFESPGSQQFEVVFTKTGFNSSGTKTSFPILFINSLRDPITPLKSAYDMSELFPGSVVLRQDSTGHATSYESNCTMAYMRDYFSKGILPSPGTLCMPDVKPFGL